MADEFPEVLIRLPNIAVEYEAVAGTGSEDVVVPRQGANSRSVSGHGAEASTALSVPDLDKAFVRSYRDMRALEMI